MKTIEEFFGEVEAFSENLESRDTATIHTDWYEERSRDLYADWQKVKISLEPLVKDGVLESIDEQISELLAESRKARSSVKASVSCLNEVEDSYVEYIYPEVSHREIQAGFVNGLVADLEQVEEGKYHEYIEEAVQCVQAGAYRGSVVLAWQAAMFALYQKLEDQEESIHVSYQKKFNTTPDFNINSFWDFQKIQDKNILILAEDVGLIDKSLKDMLSKDKEIRNKAAHPGVYDVGPNGTKALIETVMQLLVKLNL